MTSVCCYFSHIVLTAQAIPQLLRPKERTTGLGCIPEGETVNYQCTVTDTTNPPQLSTVWRGSAFNCPPSTPEMTLRHNGYSGSGVRDTCGSLTAMSISGDNTTNEYTSNLTLKAATGLNGKMIECTLNGAGSAASDTILVGG